VQLPLDRDGVEIVNQPRTRGCAEVAAAPLSTPPFPC